MAGPLAALVLRDATSGAKALPPSAGSSTSSARMTDSDFFASGRDTPAPKVRTSPKTFPERNWPGQAGLDCREYLFAAADLRVSRLEDPLPGGNFDLVVSALAVHHLDGAGKADLFARVAARLRPGGRFVFGDVVVSDDPPRDVAGLSRRSMRYSTSSTMSSQPVCRGRLRSVGNASEAPAVYLLGRKGSGQELPWTIRSTGGSSRLIFVLDRAPIPGLSRVSWSSNERHSTAGPDQRGTRLYELKRGWSCSCC
jgi:SAM-dependent methyltransferase